MRILKVVLNGKAQSCENSRFALVPVLQPGNAYLEARPPHGISDSIPLEVLDVLVECAEIGGRPQRRTC